MSKTYQEKCRLTSQYSSNIFEMKKKHIIAQLVKNLRLRLKENVTNWKTYVIKLNSADTIFMKKKQVITKLVNNLRSRVRDSITNWKTYVIKFNSSNMNINLQVKLNGIASDNINEMKKNHILTQLVKNLMSRLRDSMTNWKTYVL